MRASLGQVVIVLSGGAPASGHCPSGTHCTFVCTERHGESARSPCFTCACTETASVPSECNMRSARSTGRKFGEHRKGYNYHMRPGPCLQARCLVGREGNVEMKGRSDATELETLIPERLRMSLRPYETHWTSFLQSQTTEII